MVVRAGGWWHIRSEVTIYLRQCRSVPSLGWNLGQRESASERKSGRKRERGRARGLVSGRSLGRRGRRGGRYGRWGGHEAGQRAGWLVHLFCGPREIERVHVQSVLRVSILSRRFALSGKECTGARKVQESIPSRTAARIVLVPEK